MLRMVSELSRAIASSSATRARSCSASESDATRASAACRCSGSAARRSWFTRSGAVENECVPRGVPRTTDGERLESQVFDLLVGAEGFEPPTLCSQSRCATRLRHAPNHRPPRVRRSRHPSRSAQSAQTPGARAAGQNKAAPPQARGPSRAAGGRERATRAGYARRQVVLPPGLSSTITPAAASSSRMRSDSAKSLALRALSRASTRCSTSASVRMTRG